MSEQAVLLGELSRLERKRGDVFVLHCERHLSADAQCNIRNVFAEQFGPDVKVLIVPQGLKLGIVGETELPERYEQHFKMFMNGKMDIDEIRKHEVAKP